MWLLFPGEVPLDTEKRCVLFRETMVYHEQWQTDSYDPRASTLKAFQVNAETEPKFLTSMFASPFEMAKPWSNMIHIFESEKIIKCDYSNESFWLDTVTVVVTEILSATKCEKRFFFFAGNVRRFLRSSLLRKS